MDMTTSAISHALAYQDEGPAYIYNREIFEKNIRDCAEAFTRQWPNFQLAYSIKTNMANPVVRDAGDAGAWAEVVSPMELRKALKNGHAIQKIIYNGVIPDFLGKTSVASNGGIVNLDSIEDIIALDKFLDTTPCLSFTSGHCMPIGIRVAVDIGNGEPQRFGVHPDDLTKAVAAINRSNNLRFAGLHCHVGNSRQISRWELRLEKFADAVQKIDVSSLEYLDIGGGIYGPMKPGLAKQFPEYVKSFADYANTANRILKAKLPDAEGIKLILEPGTALIGSAMSYACHVTAVKTLGDKFIVVTDGTAKHFECKKDLPVEVIKMTDGRGWDIRDISMTVVGCTCMSTDILARNLTGIMVDVGDVLVFENAGAYSYSCAGDFIVPRPRVLDAMTGEEL